MAFIHRGKRKGHEKSLIVTSHLLVTSMHTTCLDFDFLLFRQTGFVSNLRQFPKKSPGSMELYGGAYGNHQFS